MAVRSAAVASVGCMGGLLRFAIVAAIAVAAPLSLTNGGPYHLAQSNLPQISSTQTAESLLGDLADGTYQFCTEPMDLQDWQDGKGACLNIIKQGTKVSGYYGYPHSERFICVNGEISDSWLHGDGTAVSWPGHPWTEVPRAPFTWDDEGRLSLASGAVIRREGEISWIAFQQADLTMEGMYLYPSPRMNPPAQLCN